MLHAGIFVRLAAILPESRKLPISKRRALRSRRRERRNFTADSTIYRQAFGNLKEWRPFGSLKNFSINLVFRRFSLKIHPTTLYIRKNTLKSIFYSSKTKMPNTLLSVRHFFMEPKCQSVQQQQRCVGLVIRCLQLPQLHYQHEGHLRFPIVIGNVEVLPAVTTGYIRIFRTIF